MGHRPPFGYLILGNTLAFFVHDEIPPWTCNAHWNLYPFAWPQPWGFVPHLADYPKFVRLGTQKRHGLALFDD